MWRRKTANSICWSELKDMRDWVGEMWIEKKEEDLSSETYDPVPKQSRKHSLTK